MSFAHARPVARLFIAVSAFLALTYIALAVTGVGERAAVAPIRDWIYIGAVLLAVLATALRAFAPGPRRAPWVCFSLSALCWILGNVVKEVLTADGSPIALPSLADAFWIWPVPLAGLGAILVIRRGPVERRRGLWLDSALAVTTLASISAAFVIGPALRLARDQDTAGLVTILVYPILDVASLGAVLVFIISRRFRVSPTICAVTLGALFMVVTDGAYVDLQAAGTYSEGDLIDAGWLLAGLAVAIGSQMDDELRPRRTRAVLEQLLPTVLTTVALALLIFEALSDADPLTIIVAGVALVAAIARGAMTMAENLALLGESRVEALTDPLTGLGNRRQMQQDLAAYDGVPQAIAMFDLDGFKTYNDTYGHGAGDVLLRRIAEALDQSVQPHGRAYRMGGDEFSALLPPDADVAGIAALLTQSGDGFVVTASYGAALMPGDATDPDDALRIADARMYMCKFRGRAAADRQSADVLLAVMQERSLDLARHGGQVATLAEQVAANMGLEEPELAKIRHAAQLHDIGKLAVPEAILNKPGPLSAEEWEFMRQHTVVGERILRAAPALSNVAAVVRSTHERWDGHGYPDGVAGGDIPLAARIVFVCDALDAMTEDRVYRPGLSLGAALAELTANAGTQFDPAVVEALVATVHSRPAPALTLVPAGIAID